MEALCERLFCSYKTSQIHFDIPNYPATHLSFDTIMYSLYLIPALPSRSTVLSTDHLTSGPHSCGTVASTTARGSADRTVGRVYLRPWPTTKVHCSLPSHAEAPPRWNWSPADDPSANCYFAAIVRPELSVSRDCECAARSSRTPGTRFPCGDRRPKTNPAFGTWAP